MKIIIEFDRIDAESESGEEIIDWMINLIDSSGENIFPLLRYASGLSFMNDKKT